MAFGLDELYRAAQQGYGGLGSLGGFAAQNLAGLQNQFPAEPFDPPAPDLRVLLLEDA